MNSQSRLWNKGAKALLFFASNIRILWAFGPYSPYVFERPARDRCGPIFVSFYMTQNFRLIRPDALSPIRLPKPRESWNCPQAPLSHIVKNLTRFSKEKLKNECVFAFQIITWKFQEKQSDLNNEIVKNITMNFYNSLLTLAGSCAIMGLVPISMARVI